MALRRKPKSESKKTPSADERRIEALIDKGGSVAPDHEGGRGGLNSSNSVFPVIWSSASTWRASSALSRRPVMRGCSKHFLRSWKPRNTRKSLEAPNHRNPAPVSPSCFEQCVIN